MADNPKKKKADAKRFALMQKHERTYMKKQLLKLIKAFEKDAIQHRQRNNEDSHIILYGVKPLQTKPIIRCLKGALKLLLYVEKQLKKKSRRKKK